MTSFLLSLKEKAARFWNRESPRFSFFLIFLLCFLGYRNSLTHAFMLDDYFVLFGQEGVAHKTFLSLFTDWQYLFYRPAGHIFLFLSHKLFGVNVFAYHLANLGLFSLAVFLFFRLTLEITGNKGLAWGVAFLYGWHPLNNMLVNYVTANIIATFVVMMQISFLFAVKASAVFEKRFYATSLLFYLLALLSHEMSLVYPLYVFCLAYFLRGRSLKRALVFSLPFGLLAAGYFLFRMHLFTLGGTLQAVKKVLPHVSIYFSCVMPLLYWYVKRLFFPIDFVFLWTGHIEQEYLFWEPLRFLAIVAVIGYFLFVRWKKGLKPFALAFFVTGLLPTFWASFAHFPFAEPFIEPHWFYFGSFGFFLLLAYALSQLRGRISQALWILVMAGILSGSFFLLQRNNAYWKDQKTYCRYWLKINPRNATPYYGLGQALLKEGDPRQAVRYLEKAMETARYQSAFMTADLGYAYFLSGKLESARKYLAFTLQRDPDYAAGHYYSGLLFLHEGKKPESQQAFEKAVQLYPGNPEYRRALEALGKQ